MIWVTGSVKTEQIAFDNRDMLLVSTHIHGTHTHTTHTLHTPSQMNNTNSCSSFRRNVNLLASILKKTKLNHLSLIFYWMTLVCTFSWSHKIYTSRRRLGIPHPHRQKPTAQIEPHRNFNIDFCFLI